MFFVFVFEKISRKGGHVCRLLNYTSCGLEIENRLKLGSLMEAEQNASNANNTIKIKSKQIMSSLYNNDFAGLIEQLTYISINAS